MPPVSTAIEESTILAARGARNAVDPDRPYAFLVEAERTAAGAIEDVATVFLTNRECPLKCLMCDLWKNTTTSTVEVGAIPRQIDYALARLPSAQHIKLYNSGNFFDPQAIPPDDYAPIIDRVSGFDTVIVENHPRFCTSRVRSFHAQLGTQLEVAIGLETAHPEVLARLNKRMTLDDYARAVEFLLDDGIAVRSFVLLRPPFLAAEESCDWAVRSVEYAFGWGVRCCAVVPVRDGNGIMERLRGGGDFAPPTLAMMERVLEATIALGGGRALMDLWDAERIADCPHCAAERIERLHWMNLHQTSAPRIACRQCGG